MRLFFVHLAVDPKFCRVLLARWCDSLGGLGHPEVAKSETSRGEGSAGAVRTVDSGPKQGPGFGG